MEAVPEDAPKSPYSVMGILTHPLTGFIVAIAGIIVGIFLYYAAEKEPKLVVLIHPVRSPIVQTGRYSDLSVSFGGKPIKGGSVGRAIRHIERG